GNSVSQRHTPRESRNATGRRCGAKHGNFTPGTREGDDRIGLACVTWPRSRTEWRCEATWHATLNARIPHQAAWHRQISLSPQFCRQIELDVQHRPEFCRSPASKSSARLPPRTMVAPERTESNVDVLIKDAQLPHSPQTGDWGVLTMGHAEADSQEK